MKRSLVLPVLVGLCLLALPYPAPAPLIYVPGEGWTYETPGSEGKWKRTRAKDQLNVAQEAFDAGKYRLTTKAAKRVVREWPMSDYAPQAQYLVARSYEKRKNDERAFKEYQRLIEKYPRTENYEDSLGRQYEIAGRFLAGQWFKLFGVVPFFPSMNKTADMFEKVVRNGPYSPVGPKAQMNIGTAREKSRDYPLAVKAYETAADRYFDRPEVAADAVYRAGMAHLKQAQKAEYDQGAAGRAIVAFTEFYTLFPTDKRAAEVQKLIADLKREQARGNYEVARFYEKNRRWAAAMIYYNEVRLLDPQSPQGEEAGKRIEALKKKTLGPAPVASK